MPEPVTGDQIRDLMTSPTFMSRVYRNARPTRNLDVRTALEALADTLDDLEPVDKVHDHGRTNA